MRAERIINKSFAILFILLGLGALIGAVFYGAKHHYFTVGVCILLSIILLTIKND